MILTLRAGLLAGAILAIGSPAQAQSIFGEFFADPPRRAAPQQRTAPRLHAQPQRAPVQQSLLSWDDDEDDTPSARPAPQRRLNPAVRGPAMLDGGARPAIAAAAPPVVAYSGPQAAGTVVIDTRGRALYYVLGGGRAYRYPIAVGREGFTWAGTQTVSRIASWPDWRPPAEMRQRQPGLPELMTGGLRNPLGARAIYLGSTLYRIHGTNDARSIGSASSSGCFRMTNANVVHLAGLVRVGTTVQVLRGLPARAVASTAASAGRS